MTTFRALFLNEKKTKQNISTTTQTATTTRRTNDYRDGDRDIAHVNLDCVCLMLTVYQLCIINTQGNTRESVLGCAGAVGFVTCCRAIRHTSVWRPHTDEPRAQTHTPIVGNLPSTAPITGLSKFVMTIGCRGVRSLHTAGGNKTEYSLNRIKRY